MKSVASDGFEAMKKRGIGRGRRIRALPQLWWYLRFQFLMGAVKGGNELKREKEREGGGVIMEKARGGERYGL